MKILLTGATGFIGKELGKLLAEKGHRLYVVSRNAEKAKQILPYPCEIIQGDLNDAVIVDPRLQEIEAVINLMGEPVMGEKWTDIVKRRIYNSRVLGTRHLVQSFLNLKDNKLKTFISGSAIGFYGDRGDELCRELDKSGNDFLASLTADWENELTKIPTRTCIIRTGIVLAFNGGAIEKMLFPFKAGVGGVLGDGKHWMSWIHLQDLINIFAFALERQDCSGVINGVAPNSVTNRDFSISLAKNLGRKLALPVPAAVMKVMYGEAASVVLSSIKASAEKIESLGFQFRYKDLDEALSEVCSSFKSGSEVYHTEQFFAQPPEKLFQFFKDPANLERITPPSLNFNIESVSTPEIGEGTLIDYRLKIHGVPAKWRTLIKEWQPPYKFVDTQLRGPYRVWHHTHEFRPFCGGTLMLDTVRYCLPLGYLGWAAGRSFIKKDIETIFQYRRQYISKLEKIE